MKPELRRPIQQPRRSATPAPAANSPAELVQRLEILDKERKEIIRELVVSFVEESLGDELLLVDRTRWVDRIITTLPAFMRDTLSPLVPSIVDAYLRECGVAK